MVQGSVGRKREMKIRLDMNTKQSIRCAKSQSSRDEEEITNGYKEYEETLEMNKGYSTETEGR
jgi:hypothetical protein